MSNLAQSLETLKHLTQAGADALHAEWEPEESECDGRCWNDAESVVAALDPHPIENLWVCETRHSGVYHEGLARRRLYLSSIPGPCCRPLYDLRGVKP
jgi:hypothetical protein